MKIDISRDWSIFFEHQAAVSKRFGPVWNVPLQKRHTDLVVQYLESGLSVLEVGAYNRNMIQKAAIASFELNYKSLDTDPSLPHDYRNLDDVNRNFQMVWMFEVIEHMELAAAFDMLKKIIDILKPGGKLILSTPNGHHPHRPREPHHLTSFKFDSLGALLETAGFEIEALYRIHNASFIKKTTQRFLLGGVYRLLDIDFARTVAAVARKPRSENTQESP